MSDCLRSSNAAHCGEYWVAVLDFNLLIAFLFLSNSVFWIDVYSRFVFMVVLLFIFKSNALLPLGWGLFISKKILSSSFNNKNVPFSRSWWMSVVRVNGTIIIRTTIVTFCGTSPFPSVYWSLSLEILYLWTFVLVLVLRLNLPYVSVHGILHSWQLRLHRRPISDLFHEICKTERSAKVNRIPLPSATRLGEISTKIESWVVVQNLSQGKWLVSWDWIHWTVYD